jgi:hypothetical protein
MYTGSYSFEPNWVPSLQCGGTSTGISLAIQSGCWCKIGSLVMIQGSLYLSSISASGNATILTFPFAFSTNSQVKIITENISLTAGYNTYLSWSAGDTFASLTQNLGTAASDQVITAAAINSSTTINFNFVYTT